MAAKNAEERKGKAGRGREKDAPAPPDPVNVIDGMPDVSLNRAWWKYAALAAGFSAWMSVLVYCWLAG